MEEWVREGGERVETAAGEGARRSLCVSSTELVGIKNNNQPMVVVTVNGS
jgi:hypothetical protein